MIFCRECWREFPRQRVHVACHGTGCRRSDGTIRWFEPRLYPAVARALKQGRLDQATCPFCQATRVLHKACAYADCGGTLEPTAGAVPELLIGMLGDSRAGKSHFLATMVHELWRRRRAEDRRASAADSHRSDDPEAKRAPGDDDPTVDTVDREVRDPNAIPDWRAEPVDRRTERRYLERMVHPLYEACTEIPRTSGVDEQMVFRLFDSSSEHEGDPRILVPFQDYSGELTQRETLTRTLPLLHHAAGLVLIADPLAFPGPTESAADARRWERLPQQNAAHLLRDFVERVETLPLEPGAPAPRPIEQRFLAVVVTKADRVLPHGLWPQRHPPSPFDPRYDDWLDDNNRQVRAWTTTHLDPAFERTARRFREVAYFFVSSLGFEHERGPKLARTPEPLGVTAPIEWLLDRLTERRRPAGKPRAPRARSTPRRPAERRAF